MDFIFLLAPMENLTDPAFRTFCHRKGVDLTLTEMIKIEALAQKNENAWAKIKSYDETPTLIQLIGNNETKLEYFLKQFKPEQGFKGFNLNIGCPNPDIIKLGQGAAMIKRINKVKTLISVFRKYNYPISIKMRLGLNEFEKEKKVYLTLIKEIDADFFIVHSRHGKQTYKDKADFSVYEECVKTGKKIIANGDIKTKEQIDYLKSIGVHGAMIGREAINNPLIFSELKGEKKKLDFEEYLELASKYKTSERYVKAISKFVKKSI
jgi:tRNA-dihydrouridine synthase B